MPEATQSALRSVFAGIGRILNLTDKVRNKPTGAETTVNGTATETAAPETATPGTAAPETATPETAAPETAAPETTAQETATPETAAPETAAPETAAPETIVPDTVPGEDRPETAVSEDKPETAAPETAAAAAEPPLPNYDELTIASVRARLRNLSVAQLGELIEYEKTHAARADFIAMYERRIAKVESGK